MDTNNVWHSFRSVNSAIDEIIALPNSLEKQHQVVNALRGELIKPFGERYHPNTVAHHLPKLIVYLPPETSPQG